MAEDSEATDRIKAFLNRNKDRISKGGAAEPTTPPAFASSSEYFSPSSALAIGVRSVAGSALRTNTESPSPVHSLADKVRFFQEQQKGTLDSPSPLSPENPSQVPQEAKTPGIE